MELSSCFSTAFIFLFLILIGLTLFLMIVSPVIITYILLNKSQVIKDLQYEYEYLDYVLFGISGFLSVVLFIYITTNSITIFKNVGLMQ